MKIGIEVEGRFKGLMTLFMQADEALEFFQFKSLKERSDKDIDGKIEQVKHIYVSDHENKLRHTDACLHTWKSMGMPVTIEVTRIQLVREHFPPNVHFMLTIVDGTPGVRGTLYQNASFWHLLPTDQIKFSSPKDSYHQVYCVTKENMSQTRPHDFQGDFEFNASSDSKYKVNAT